MRWSLVLSVATLALCAVGCGRKATRADCELIVDRNIEVKLKADGLNDPVLVQKKKDELRASLRDDIDKCVGKRVTDGKMDCVRAAQTPDEIGKCLR